MVTQDEVKICFILGNHPSDEARGFVLAIQKELEKETNLIYKFVEREANPEIWIVLGLDQEQYVWLQQMITSLEFGGYAIFYHPDFVQRTLFESSVLNLQDGHKGKKLVHAFPNVKWLRHALPSVWRYLTQDEEESPEAESPPV